MGWSAARYPLRPLPSSLLWAQDQLRAKDVRALKDCAPGDSVLMTAQGARANRILHVAKTTCLSFALIAAVLGALMHPVFWAVNSDQPIGFLSRPQALYILIAFSQVSVIICLAVALLRDLPRAGCKGMVIVRKRKRLLSKPIYVRDWFLISWQNGAMSWHCSRDLLAEPSLSSSGSSLPVLATKAQRPPRQLRRGSANPLDRQAA